MTPKVTPCRPVKEDPAGLDKVLLSVGKATHDFIQRKAASIGLKLPDLWSGQEGLGSVIEQAIKENGIPNQRFGELVTPRKVAERAGLVGMHCPKKRTLKRRAAR